MKISNLIESSLLLIGLVAVLLAGKTAAFSQSISISSYAITGGGTVVSNSGIRAYCAIGEPLASSRMSTNGITATIGIGPALAPAPYIEIQRTTSNTVAVSWPSSTSADTTTNGMIMMTTTNLASGTWSYATNNYSNDGFKKTLILNPPGSATAVFHRGVDWGSLDPQPLPPGQPWKISN